MGDSKELSQDTAASLRYVERYHEEQAAYGGASFEHHARMLTNVANARAELEELRAEKQARFAGLAAAVLEDVAQRVEMLAPECATTNPVQSARDFAAALASVLREYAKNFRGTIPVLVQTQADITELVTAIASGEPVTEAHRDLAKAIQERWESEAKGG